MSKRSLLILAAVTLALAAAWGVCAGTRHGGWDPGLIAV